jgi:saccharopine dehydrogenase-like NADP-dependent oxidoreductase
MGQSLTFGIVGGYGATGSVVASELLKSGEGEILIGGRDSAKAAELAVKLGGRASAVLLDVVDSRSLDNFCGRCSIVVNCAGPVMLLQDRVAQTAFRRRCHYVDVAGLSFVAERMLPHAGELATLGLSCVVSAGWTPGLTELLPLYAATRARTEMDAIESVTSYFGDSGQWSGNAFLDMVSYLRRFSLASAASFHKGERARAAMHRASLQVDLGSPFGVCRFNMFSTPEFDEVGRRLKDCDVAAYSYLPGVRPALAGAVVALLPMPSGFAARMLRQALSRSPLPAGGFIRVKVLGRYQGSRRALTVQLVYDRHCEYRINGLVPAIVARMIAQGKCVQPGVHYPADAVDPIVFLADLRKAGFEPAENFESSE